jgi:hypothetical protein
MYYTSREKSSDNRTLGGCDYNHEEDEERLDGRKRRRLILSIDRGEKKGAE